jgi:ABC-type transporter Mla subunit MlaD
VIEGGRRRRRRGNRRVIRALLLAIVVAVVFGFGVALGQALEEGPGPTRTVTRVRTLKPLPLPPVRETVTVHGRSD